VEKKREGETSKNYGYLSGFDSSRVDSVQLIESALLLSKQEGETGEGSIAGENPFQQEEKGGTFHGGVKKGKKRSPENVSFRMWLKKKAGLRKNQKSRITPEPRGESLFKLGGKKGRWEWATRTETDPE